MPKELIRSDHPAYGTREEPEAYGFVDVRWDRETGYFQIATTCLDPSTYEVYTPLREAIEAPLTPPGEPPQFTELIALEGPMPVQAGYYVNLDRRGINELIRTLRRARDAAFGKDE